MERLLGVEKRITDTYISIKDLHAYATLRQAKNYFTLSINKFDTWAALIQNRKQATFRITKIVFKAKTRLAPGTSSSKTLENEVNCDKVRQIMPTSACNKAKE